MLDELAPLLEAPLRRAAGARCSRRQPAAVPGDAELDGAPRSVVLAACRRHQFRLTNWSGSANCRLPIVVTVLLELELAGRIERQPGNQVVLALGPLRSPSCRRILTQPERSMNVVIVESPAKAKTINKYLGKGYTVLASYGHVRDLPAKDGSVRPDEDFAMSWEVDEPRREAPQGDRAAR